MTRRTFWFLFGVSLISFLFLTRMQRGLPFEFHVTQDDGYHLLFAHNALFDGSVRPSETMYDSTVAANLKNPFGCGASLVWFVPGLVIKLLTVAAGFCGNGDCAFVYSWFGGLSAALIFGSLVFLVGFLNRFFDNRISIVIASAAVLTTLAPYYFLFRSMMAHGAEVFIFSALLFMLAWAPSNQRKKWPDFLFGLAVGLLCITRFQDVVWAPSLMALWWIRRFGFTLKHAPQAAALVAGFVLALSPQFVFLLAQRGEIPQAINQLYPVNYEHQKMSSYFSLFPGWQGRLLQIFWGPGFGFFSMTPLMLVGLAGSLMWFVSIFKRNKSKALIVSAAFLIPSAALALLSSNSINMSYGNRYMLTAYLVMLPGAAYLLTAIYRNRNRWIRWVGTLVFAGCLWIGLASYLLFHTNHDTLTLTPDHPAYALGQYFPNGLLTNPTYDRNALDVIVHEPHKPILSVAASLAGGLISKLPMQIPVAKFVEYHEDHFVPFSLQLAYLLGFLVSGLIYGGFALSIVRKFQVKA